MLAERISAYALPWKRDKAALSAKLGGLQTEIETLRCASEALKTKRSNEPSTVGEPASSAGSTAAIEAFIVREVNRALDDRFSHDAVADAAQAGSRGRGGCGSPSRRRVMFGSPAVHEPAVNVTAEEVKHLELRISRIERKVDVCIGRCKAMQIAARAARNRGHPRVRSGRGSASGQTDSATGLPEGWKQVEAVAGRGNGDIVAGRKAPVAFGTSLSQPSPLSPCSPTSLSNRTDVGGLLLARKHLHPSKNRLSTVISRSPWFGRWIGFK